MITQKWRWERKGKKTKKKQRSLLHTITTFVSGIGSYLSSRVNGIKKGKMRNRRRHADETRKTLAAQIFLLPLLFFFWTHIFVTLPTDLCARNDDCKFAWQRCFHTPVLSHSHIHTLFLSLSSSSFTQYINTLLDTLGITDFAGIRDAFPFRRIFIVFSGKSLTNLGKSPGIQNVPKEAAKKFTKLIRSIRPLRILRFVHARI